MKLTWKKEKNVKKRPLGAVSQYPNLPFEQQNNQFDTELRSRGEPGAHEKQAFASGESSGPDTKQLAKSFREQGDKLAEEGKYSEALGKWEAALNLMPDTAALHEQKAQVLLEIGDAWSALKAATSMAQSFHPSLLIFPLVFNQLDKFWINAKTRFSRCLLIPL
ncbi:tetratricopeptide repeat protein 33 [Tripterygium wilfordii]|uniref:Tetratricopeptide repeat protein 33 n=1 Tax=Tripterygium wilfordii TaxID=458696 RepID=A0A7J7BUH2_TRIWF|nr:tetratricopeptide repeat protein 33 [Tripterygium wilfordii]